MLYSLKIILIMAGLTSSVLSGQELTNFIPAIPHGWKTVQDDRTYSEEELYDYINGGAELFLSYDMSKVISRIISKDENEIRIEIFDMQGSENAFGVFSHTRTQDERQFGQGSQFFVGTLIFWKSNYYISLTANDSNDEINNAIVELARDIDSKITDDGSIPEIIHLLPKKYMLEDAYIYFHHSIWQNSYHFIANDNFLNIDNSTPSLLAKYGNAENRYYLLIIKYPNSESTQINLNVFKERFLNENPDDLVYQIEDESWWGATSERNFLVAVINAPSHDAVDQLLESAKNNIITKP